MIPGLNIFSDFDGTISKQDSLKILLDEFGGSRWHEIESALLSRRISERVALTKAFEIFPLTVSEASNWLMQKVELDSSFLTFVQWTKERGIPLTILSGGFIQFIRPLLAQHGLQNLRVVANSASDSAKGWKIQSASMGMGCDDCHHCKCESLQKGLPADRLTRVAYIGDGHTDFCPVSNADFIFAKKSLAKHCQEQGFEFFAYENFRDVRNQLEALTVRRAA